tara:strand:+ start:2039 stop:2458 length:420 start_codon:yes stop_codon:yes gene_type:complete
MKTLTTLTLAALTTLALNGNAFANKVHTLDDIHEAERQAQRAAAHERHLLRTDPNFLKKIKKEQAKQEQESKFQGQGHRLGGDKYVNRLLGIDHKEGKRLAKLAKKAQKRPRTPLFYAKAVHAPDLVITAYGGAATLTR